MFSTPVLDLRLNQIPLLIMTADSPRSPRVPMHWLLSLGQEISRSGIRVQYRPLGQGAHWRHCVTYLRSIKLSFFCVALFALLLPIHAYPSSAQSGQQEAVDFVLVVDMSSSMWDNDPEDRRIKAVKLFAELLAPQDRIAIVGFSASARVITDLTDKNQLPSGVWDQLSNKNIPGRGNPTDTSKGLEAAFQSLDNRPADEKQSRHTATILLTDGRPCPNDGNETREYADIERQVESFRAQGWPVYTVGLCMYEDDNTSVAKCLRCDTALLRNIAGTTGGLYVRAESDRQLPEVYVDVLADIYGFREQVRVAVEAEKFSAAIPPQARIAIVIAQQEGFNLEAACPDIVELTPRLPEGDRRFYSQASGCVEDIYVLRTDPEDGSVGGVWDGSTSAPNVTIEAILINIEYEVRMVRPRSGDSPCAGSEVEVVTHVVDQEGRDVGDEGLLEAIALSVRIYRDGTLVDTISSARSEGAVWRTWYQLPSEPGRYGFHPAINGYMREREKQEINVIVCEHTPTPRPTDTPTPTDTPIPTHTPIPSNTPTNTPIPTDTPTPTATNTPTTTPTPTPTHTSTITPTPTPTHTPTITPTPTPTPTPVIRLDISDDGLEMENDLVATFGIDSTSPKPERLSVDSISLSDASHQPIQDLRAELRPQQIPPQGQISASLILTSSLPLAYGDYGGQVSFKSESGLDVVPSKTALAVRILSPWQRFWRRFRGLIAALLGLSVIGVSAYAFWWRRVRPVVDGGMIVNAIPPGGSVQVGKLGGSIQAPGEFIVLSRLRKRPITLGSGLAADIRLVGDDIDDIQAEIQATGWRRQGSRIRVVNKGQMNATVVSGIEVHTFPQALYDGDIIEVGGYELEYQNQRQLSPYD
jgi:uncharacterized protein YegL